MFVCDTCNVKITSSIVFDKKSNQHCAWIECGCGIQLERFDDEAQAKKFIGAQHSPEAAPKIFTLGGKPASHCKGCKSAVTVASMNGLLCKVCDARRLEQEDRDATALEDEAQREAELEEAAIATRAAMETMGLGEDGESETRIIRKAQGIFDNLRMKAGLPYRLLNDDFTTATVPQFGALRKMGWLPEDIKALKLSISDASRLLQRGPLWLQQKA